MSAALRLFLSTRLAFAFGAALPAVATAQQPGADSGASSRGRVEIAPAEPVVTAGDSLRITARLLDASGKPVPDATIRFQTAGPGPGFIDSTGMLHAGAPGTVNIAVVALVPGGRPVIRRMGVRVVPGPPARLQVAGIQARLRYDD